MKKNENSTNELVKKCPFCAEEIKEEAIVCKHCKSSLIEEKEIEVGLNEEEKRYFYGKKPKKNSYSDWDGKKPSKNGGKINRGFISFLVILIIAAGYWISIGTPNPTLFFAEDLAKKECLRLANENKDSWLFNNETIRANDTWLKDGKRVVQLLQDDDDDGINQIMCIYGNDMVQIPGRFEQGKWR